MRQEHKAGEKLFVDWVGTTIPIYDPRGGPVQQAHLFVAVLGASSYTYAEATSDEQLANWIGASAPRHSGQGVRANAFGRNGWGLIAAEACCLAVVPFVWLPRNPIYLRN